MKLWLIVPVKPFHEGKSRLAGALAPTERTHLNRCLFTHVMQQALATPVLAGIIVVSRDPTVLQSTGLQNIGVHSEGLQNRTLQPNIPQNDAPPKTLLPTLHFEHERGRDLNLALAQGRQAALEHGADAILILPADLPKVTTADIEALYHRGQQAAGVLLVPSTDNGTNALLLQPPMAIDFAFGRNSFTHHRHAALQANIPCTIHRSPTLAFDLDSPPDLVHLCSALTHRSQPEFPPHHSG